MQRKPLSPLVFALLTLLFCGVSCQGFEEVKGEDAFDFLDLDGAQYTEGQALEVGSSEADKPLEEEEQPEEDVQEAEGVSEGESSEPAESEEEETSETELMEV